MVGWMDGRNSHRLEVMLSSLKTESLTHFFVTIHSVPRMIPKREPESRGKLRTSPYFVMLGRYLVEKIQEVVLFIQRVNR